MNISLWRPIWGSNLPDLHLGYYYIILYYNICIFIAFRLSSLSDFFSAVWATKDVFSGHFFGRFHVIVSEIPAGYDQSIRC